MIVSGIAEGDRVLVPDFTFLATGNVILQMGAEPKLMDINLDTFCLDIDKIEEHFEENVKAILPVHAFGYPSDIMEINKIAKTHETIVIEDAALAVGSMINGQKIGSHGNMACFSLQGRKIITTGEGGMIVVDDDETETDLRALRSQGMYRNPKGGKGLPLFKKLGFSYRLSDIQACIGIEQLRRIETFIDRRNQLAKCYRDSMTDRDLDVIIPNPPINIRHNYQSFVILVKKNRDKIIDDLKGEGIESTIGTYSLGSQPLFSRYKRECPNSLYAFEHSIALPMYHELKESDVDYITKSLAASLK
jgi:dTDP-4-amino-4,6-dideoxygalactose transaminase